MQIDSGESLADLIASKSLASCHLWRGSCLPAVSIAASPIGERPFCFVFGAASAFPFSLHCFGSYLIYLSLPCSPSTYLLLVRFLLSKTICNTSNVTSVSTRVITRSRCIKSITHSPTSAHGRRTRMRTSRSLHTDEIRLPGRRRWLQTVSSYPTLRPLR